MSNIEIVHIDQFFYLPTSYRTPFSFDIQYKPVRIGRLVALRFASYLTCHRLELPLLLLPNGSHWAQTEAPNASA